MEDATAVILENEKLIYKSASHFRNYSNIDDLYQAGCLGIVEASKNYDPNSKAKFSTYAYSYIIGEMKKLVREDKLVKVSRDTYRLRGKIEEARSLLAQTMMKEPNDKELSEFLEIPEQHIAEAINSGITPKHLDQPVGDTNMLMYEVISNPNASIDDLLYLKTELEALEEPERTIMMNRYYEDMTQSEIANNLGLTQVDVSRKEAKVLSKIKATN